MKNLEDYFEIMVEIPRIKVGKQQTVETLINEEALLFAQHLRNEHTKCARAWSAFHVSSPNSHGISAIKASIMF